VWEDVTSDYAGFSFRAEGGGSATFGEMQTDLFFNLCNILSKMTFA